MPHKNFCVINKVLAWFFSEKYLFFKKDFM